jgi:septal ring factor EnvC (AmiA/AmiB activator)
MGTLYFTARSHLDSTTQQLSTTRNTLATVQGQLNQTKSDNQSLTTQKNDLANQIASMTPCAKSAKALADLLDTDIKNNVNPFLDANIVNPISTEVTDCR